MKTGEKASPIGGQGPGLWFLALSPRSRRKNGVWANTKQQSGEVFPAMWLERLRAMLGEQRNGRLAGAEFRDAADGGDLDAGDFAGKAGCGRGGEEEFVVFAAVDGLGQGCGGVDGQGGSGYLGGYAGLGAEVSEVGGEAVAKVDSG